MKKCYFTMLLIFVLAKVTFGQYWNYVGNTEAFRTAYDNTGTIWEITTNSLVYYYNNSTNNWIQYSTVNNGGLDIAACNNIPYKIGSDNLIYYGTGNEWKQLPGGGAGKRIACDCSSNTVWIIGMDNLVYYSTASGWKQFASLQTAIDITANNGNPYIIGSNNLIYIGTEDSAWVQVPGGGAGSNIFYELDGNLWIIGMDSSIYFQNNGNWQKIASTWQGTDITANNGIPYIVGLDRCIYGFVYNADSVINWGMEKSVNLSSVDSAFQDFTGLGYNYISQTCVPYHIDYSPITQHIQGYAEVDNIRVLSHSISYKDYGLLIANYNNNTNFYQIGSLRHPGGIQFCGRILIFPSENLSNEPPDNSKVYFIDFTNPNNPVTLSVIIDRPNAKAGGAGLVFNPALQCHFAIVYDANKLSLYKSNGQSFFGNNISFSQVGNDMQIGGWGGSSCNLLYEEATNKLFAILFDDADHNNLLYIFEIENYTSGSPKATYKKSINLGDISDFFNPVFRFGAGLSVAGPVRLSVYGTERTLCGDWTFDHDVTYYKWDLHAKASYTLTFVTGSQSGAGTDSNISIQITGTQGTTNSRVINILLSGNIFENGDTDFLTISDFDVGEIQSITITSDGKYAGPDWLLSEINILKNGRNYAAQCNQWINGGTTVTINLK